MSPLAKLGLPGILVKCTATMFYRPADFITIIIHALQHKSTHSVLSLSSCAFSQGPASEHIYYPHKLVDNDDVNDHKIQYQDLKVKVKRQW